MKHNLIENRSSVSGSAAVLNWGDSASPGKFGNAWRHLPASQMRGGVLLACSGRRPRVPLSILRYTGQTPITKNDPTLNVKSSKVRKHYPSLMPPKDRAF